MARITCIRSVTVSSHLPHRAVGGVGPKANSLRMLARALSPGTSAGFSIDRSQRRISMRILSWTFAVFAGICLFAGAAAAQNSGFLGDSYSKLGDAQSPSGQKVKRWLSPTMAAGKY